ncbi:chemotaxis protein [Novosphingobium flavum]|uniref:Chemotaxis protein n=1 Tax=Novosphingobium flavum TaxID=1778672 RepID=A0A7X1KKL0_9SPHN|nr:methyl-accepting chemotaxis protein [Novosphingobium flavum]MBC2664378.1 chemotaxis protein [Novosphingobium flavum]
MHGNVLELAMDISRITGEKIAGLEQIMLKTKMLSINARLEAARAGEIGQSFSVVAREMGTVADEVNAMSAELNRAMNDNAARIEQAGREMMLGMRGSRLADIARNTVEIIDRNLYERSCDVRWWATDSAVVDAVESPAIEAARHASSRLATILRSYTVYLDLWIADATGRIVATGRPERYPGLTGRDVSREDWFREGIQTADGDAFTVCDVAQNPALGGADVAAYATAIRVGGEPNGRALGVLGIFFDWRPQAQAIVTGVSLSDEERAASRVMLLDARHKVIASSDGRTGDTFALKAEAAWGHYAEGRKLVAYGLTPGYETYQGLGWYGCIETSAAL